MPLDWIIAFHSTSWHLLISIVHFSHLNSRLPHYLHISRVVLIDTAFCCLEQYQRCCFAALRSFLSICWQVLPVAMACWWNASFLLHAVKPPVVPQPFQMCFIISVFVMWLVCTMATLISHIHIHWVHGLDKGKAAELPKLWNILLFLLSLWMHKASKLNWRWCRDVTLQRVKYRAEVCWITWWKKAILFANAPFWVAKW